MPQDNDRFKALLDESYDWPSEFHFKFIVKADQLEELKRVLNTERLSVKPSKKNNYMSVSAKLKLASSEEVLYVYEKVKQIKGLIAL